MFGENSGTKVIEHNLLPKNKLNEIIKKNLHICTTCAMLDEEHGAQSCCRMNLEAEN